MFSLILTVLGQAPVEPTGDADLVQWFIHSTQWIVEQFQAKNYLPAVAAIVMMLTFAAKKVFKDKLSDSKLALVSAGLGLVTSVCTELVGMAVGTGGFDIVRAIVGGLIVGPLASGFWSLVGKAIFKKPDPAPAATDATAAKK